MSIFDAIFSSKPAAPAAPAATPSPAPVPADSNTPDPQNKGTPPTGDNKEVSPLDAFKDLFTLDPKKPDDQGPKDPFAVSPDAVYKSVQSADFTRVIDKETLEKINAGGAEAQTAMLQAMNKMQQLALAQATMLATQMSQKAVQHTLERVQDLVPDLIRSSRTDEEFGDQYPALNHPAARPIVKALTSQFAAKHPDKSAREIKEMVGDYLTTFSGLIAGKQSDDENLGFKDRTGGKRKNPSDVDWEDLFLKG